MTLEEMRNELKTIRLYYSDKKRFDEVFKLLPHKKVKVYSDGSHYIGIPHTTNAAAAKRRQVPEEEISVLEESK